MQATLTKKVTLKTGLYGSTAAGYTSPYVAATHQPESPPINVGAGLDIPVGYFLTGAKGETIICGGASKLVGITGAPNQFKSTLQDYMAWSVLNVLRTSVPYAILTCYDNEQSKTMSRQQHLSKRFPYIPEDIVLSTENKDGCFVLNTKADMDGVDWLKSVSKSITDRCSSKIRIKYTAFKDSTGKVLELPIPEVATLDSLSELSSSKLEKDLLENIGTSGSNMTYAQGGLFKSHIVSQIPGLASKGNTIFFMTAHKGKVSITQQQGPINIPERQIANLKVGDKIKKIPENFLFLSNVLYEVKSSLLTNKTTMLPEYPTSYGSMHAKDLYVMTVSVIRAKGGMSAPAHTIVVSQTDGVLPALTEFHYIKENDRYGLIGNSPTSVHYALAIYPDVTLSRTTVRDKLDEDPLLCRAVNIVSEWLQIKHHHPNMYRKYKDWIDSPTTVYEKIKELGYDWAALLDTRGYWIPDQYNEEIQPFLSSIDILRTCAGEYIPYFLPTKKKDK